MAVNGAAETAVQMAAQTGRLDLLTAILAVLALMIGAATFPLFFFLKKRAEDVAADAAEEALQGAIDRVEAAAVLRMEQLLPTLIEDYRRLAENAVGAEEADKIAATFEEAEGEKKR
jgi:hypothetical protein